MSRFMIKPGASAELLTRVLKAGKTIADLEKLDHISTEHISEAIRYRTLDRSIF